MSPSARRVVLASLLAEGRISWDAAFRLQKEAEARAKAGLPETLFLLEHEDVITLGRNASEKDLHVSPEWLAAQGVHLCHADRGGKLTFHGPGQLVAYPILNLSPDRCDIRRYVRDLEEVLIRTVADFGVTAARSDIPDRWSSIWVGNDKLAAIGVHLSRWVTTHGVALNVHPNLARFSLFTPCGIVDGGVTSLERLLGKERAPTISQVADRFTSHFSAVFDRNLWVESGKESPHERAPVL
ncbi:MAG: lipoyl(octanoyl) transferase LipB [Acidobacteria bacterium]|nr:lipoyl(octanoyl) transferase LipB [Acidobacteriota bacterium]